MAASASGTARGRVGDILLVECRELRLRLLAKQWEGKRRAGERRAGVVEGAGASGKRQR